MSHMGEWNIQVEDHQKISTQLSWAEDRVHVSFGDVISGNGQTDGLKLVLTLCSIGHWCSSCQVAASCKIMISYLYPLVSIYIVVAFPANLRQFKPMRK